MPPPEVLDLFAVPEAPEPLPGGQQSSFRAGDLVLSPGRDAHVAEWLNPVLARLSVRLDEAPGRRRRDLRVALPVPARDGSWVVDGWAATRWEPGASQCEDLEVTLAAGRLLHAQLDAVVGSRPSCLDVREDRWARAERLALGPTPDLVAVADVTVAAVVPLLDDLDLGREQLVHADLAGNVLIDGDGAPLVIDVSPAWRPPRWAEAVCVLDSVLWHGAERAVLEPWRHGPNRQAMLRAVLFRVLADGPGHDGTYVEALAWLVG